VLVVFDCCYAGKLCHRDRSSAIFQFLGACSAEQRTAGPGENSFTAALIWALKELKDGPPFTTDQLRQKIVKCPEFPRDKIPALGNPIEPSRLDLVMICPMNNQPDQMSMESLKKNAKVQFESIDLRFHYSQKISEELLIHTAEKLTDLITAEQNLFVDSITFLEKHSTLSPDEIAKKAVDKWRQHVQWQRKEKQTLASLQGSSEEEQTSAIVDDLGMISAEPNIKVGPRFHSWKSLLDLILNGIKFCYLRPWYLIFDRKAVPDKQDPRKWEAATERKRPIH
jgi:hypothetical protein